jgi:hypothetical protein
VNSVDERAVQGRNRFCEQHDGAALIASKTYSVLPQTQHIERCAHCHDNLCRHGTPFRRVFRINNSKNNVRMKTTQDTEGERTAADTPCCPATTIRTEETKTLLQLIDSILGQWHGFPLRDTLDSAALEQIVRDIDRARRQFDGKLFFVVVFGPLKAGKSTLTNALAGEYVSPAGFGKETTRRPSLVVQASESGIDQYFSTDPDVNHSLSQREVGRNVRGISPGEDETHRVAKVREAFDAVADYLRGIRSKDEFQGRIRVSTLPLNGPLLEKSLTQNLVTEPLLTVIRCKGGHLLSKGVAIVDMPGLAPVYELA